MYEERKSPVLETGQMGEGLSSSLHSTIDCTTPVGRRQEPDTCQTPEEFDTLKETVSNDELQLIEDLLRLISSAALPEYRGTLKRVLIGHLLIARKRQHLIHSAGIRELAVSSGVTKHTACKRNHDLEKLGYVRLVREDDIEHATLWTFDTETLQRDLEPCCVRDPLYYNNGSSTQQSQFYPGTWDAFQHWKSGGEVWRILKFGGEYTVTDLAKRTRFSKSTISRTINKMQELGMVDVSQRAYCAPAGIDLKQIAKRLGTLGTEKRRKDKYLGESMKRFDANMTREEWLEKKRKKEQERRD